jgi:hypothetical protein
MSQPHHEDMGPNCSYLVRREPFPTTLENYTEGAERWGYRRGDHLNLCGNLPQVFTADEAWKLFFSDVPANATKPVDAGSAAQTVR